MTAGEQGVAFRALHERPGAFVLPNPWDVGTARVLAALGFEALATTSAGLAYSLGRRDGLGLVTRDEALAHAATIVAATPLPVSADLENCFGDEPATVAETIRAAADVGLAGASVEDSTGRADEPIYPFALAVERVAAAAEAARAAPFVLTARAENLLHGRDDLDDTIARLQAYEAAGADVLYAPGLRTLDEVRTVCAAVSRPVNVLALPGLGDVQALAAAGASRVSTGSGLAVAALSAFLAAARELREGGFGYLERSVAGRDLAAFMAGRG